VVLWSGIIFATVPFVGDAVVRLRRHVDLEVFTYAVTACVILVSAAAVALLLRRGQPSVAQYAWLAGTAGIVVYLTFDLKEGSPAEAVHFLEYGLLSLLLFNAFAHRIRDCGIYAAATIAGSIVGMIDETVQWLTPGRYFAVEDIRLNFTAVALVQVALAAGIKPRAISGWPDAAGLRRLCRLGALASAFLGICFLNTPDRIAWYSARLPLPDLAARGDGIMVEYGHLHGNAGKAVFRSRLTTEALRRSARGRAVEAARVLAKYRHRNDDFLAAYTRTSDPFLYEARAHLSSRNANLERARNATDEKLRRRHTTNAYWENRILKDHFGGLPGASGFGWPATIEAEIEAARDADRVFESRVSGHLITTFDRQQALWFFLGAVVGLLSLDRFIGKRVRG
jgi:hypothetical protein